MFYHVTVSCQASDSSDGRPWRQNPWLRYHHDVAGRLRSFRDRPATSRCASGRGRELLSARAQDRGGGTAEGVRGRASSSRARVVHTEGRTGQKHLRECTFWDVPDPFFNFFVLVCFIDFFYLFNILVKLHQGQWKWRLSTKLKRSKECRTNCVLVRIESVNKPWESANYRFRVWTNVISMISMYCYENLEEFRIECQYIQVFSLMRKVKQMNASKFWFFSFDFRSRSDTISMSKTSTRILMYGECMTYYRRKWSILDCIGIIHTFVHG